MPDLSDDELLAELGVEVEQKKARTYTPREERIIAGFEDIVRFVDEHGRAPQHGEDRDQHHQRRPDIMQRAGSRA